MAKIHPVGVSLAQTPIVAGLTPCWTPAVQPDPATGSFRWKIDRPEMEIFAQTSRTTPPLANFDTGAHIVVDPAYAQS